MENFAENFAEDFEQSLKAEAKSSAFRGTSRILFLASAAALLLQALSLLQMQVANAQKILAADFKILVTVEGRADASLVNEMGSELTSSPGVTSLKFISSQDAFTQLKASKPEIADRFVAISRNPMPEYFEIKLAPVALANAADWIKENISDAYPQTTVHYKPEQAKLIAYTAALGRFLNLAGVIVLALLAAFIFFVEAYAVGGGPRAGGIIMSIIAYGISLLIVFALSQPLVVLGGKYWVFTTPLRQGVIFFATALLGWTFAKWKRF